MGTWQDYKASSFNGGGGTSTNPFKISTPEQLAYLAYAVNKNLSYTSNGSTMYYRNASYVLTNDIKLYTNVDTDDNWYNRTWVPIGISESYPFCGTFDGRDYRILGMGIKADTVSNLYSGCTGVGLFGVVQNISGTSTSTGYKPSITNLSIVDGCIIPTDRCSISYYGLLCGKTNITSSSQDNVNIQNIRIYSDKNASGDANNRVYIASESSASQEYIGGLIGYAKRTNIYDVNIEGTELSRLNVATAGTFGGLCGYYYQSQKAAEIKRINITYNNMRKNSNDSTYIDSVSRADSTSNYSSMGGLIGTIYETGSYKLTIQNVSITGIRFNYYSNTLSAANTSYIGISPIIGTIQALAGKSYLLLSRISISSSALNVSLASGATLSSFYGVICGKNKSSYDPTIKSIYYDTKSTTGIGTGLKASSTELNAENYSYVFDDMYRYNSFKTLCTREAIIAHELNAASQTGDFTYYNDMCLACNMPMSTVDLWSTVPIRCAYIENTRTGGNDYVYDEFGEFSDGVVFFTGNTLSLPEPDRCGYAGVMLKVYTDSEIFHENGGGWSINSSTTSTKGTYEPGQDITLSQDAYIETSLEQSDKLISYKSDSSTTKTVENVFYKTTNGNIKTVINSKYKKDSSSLV